MNEETSGKGQNKTQKVFFQSESTTPQKKFGGISRIIRAFAVWGGSGGGGNWFVARQGDRRGQTGDHQIGIPLSRGGSMTVSCPHCYLSPQIMIFIGFCPGRATLRADGAMAIIVDTHRALAITNKFIFLPIKQASGSPLYLGAAVCDMQMLSRCFNVC